MWHNTRVKSGFFRILAHQAQKVRYHCYNIVLRILGKCISFCFLQRRRHYTYNPYPIQIYFLKKVLPMELIFFVISLILDWYCRRSHCRMLHTRSLAGVVVPQVPKVSSEINSATETYTTAIPDAADWTDRDRNATKGEN